MAACFNCTMEMEPRTLNHGQMSRARELAFGLFQNMERNDSSSNIFIQGMKQIVSAKEMEKTNEEEFDEQAFQSIDPRGKIQDHEAQLREPLTAPF